MGKGSPGVAGFQGPGGIWFGCGVGELEKRETSPFLNSALCAYSRCSCGVLSERI